MVGESDAVVFSWCASRPTKGAGKNVEISHLPLVSTE